MTPKNTNESHRHDTVLVWYLTTFALILGGILISNLASASAITDLPQDLGNALDISTNLAGMLLSMGMIIALAMVLAVAKMPAVGIVIALIGVIILLTAFGWLDQILLIFAGIITAIYFALTMKGIIASPGSGG